MVEEEKVGVAETYGAKTETETPTPTPAPAATANLPPFEGELKVDVKGKAPESLPTR